MLGIKFEVVCIFISFTKSDKYLANLFVFIQGNGSLGHKDYNFRFMSFDNVDHCFRLSPLKRERENKRNTRLKRAKCPKHKYTKAENLSEAVHGKSKSL